jgi:hypothetical protein
MAWSGSLGLGLVWGWLLAKWTPLAPLRQPIRQALLGRLLPGTFASALLGGLIWGFAAWAGLFAFLAGGAFAFTVHAAWRHSLKNTSHPMNELFFNRRLR